MPVAVDLMPVADLAPYARNARKHSEAAVARLVAIIEDMGWTNPILVDEDGIVAGHKRRLAAQAIYAKGGTIRLPSGAELPAGTVPVIDVSGWSEAQRRTYILADNQTTLESEWDLDTLRLELSWLQGSGEVDMGLTGFDGDALARLLTGGEGGGVTDPDDVPPEPAAPVTRLGDVWQMGWHRVICGDSTVDATLPRLLGDMRPHLMVTDPPYGVEYAPAWRARAGVNLNRKKLGKVLNDDRADWREAWALFPGDVAYVWHGALHAATVADSLTAAGFAIRSQIIWAKDRLVLSRGDYHWQHEPCWYVVRTKGKGHWSGDRKQTTVWNINARDDKGHGHSTQKPVECMRRPIENNSQPGDAVYEPFAGSGTTIIAAEMTGRRCFAVELNPAYVDVAVRRWQDFTGRVAVLDGTGETFAEVAAAREAA